MPNKLSPDAGTVSFKSLKVGSEGSSLSVLPSIDSPVELALLPLLFEEQLSDRTLSVEEVLAQLLPALPALLAVLSCSLTIWDGCVPSPSAKAPSPDLPNIEPAGSGATRPSEGIPVELALNGSCKPVEAPLMPRESVLAGCACAVEAVAVMPPDSKPVFVNLNGELVAVVGVAIDCGPSSPLSTVDGAASNTRAFAVDVLPSDRAPLGADACMASGTGAGAAGAAVTGNGCEDVLRKCCVSRHSLRAADMRGVPVACAGIIAVA